MTWVTEKGGESSRLESTTRTFKAADRRHTCNKGQNCYDKWLIDSGWKFSLHSSEIPSDVSALSSPACNLPVYPGSPCILQSSGSSGLKREKDINTALDLCRQTSREGKAKFFRSKETDWLTIWHATLFSRLKRFGKMKWTGKAEVKREYADAGKHAPLYSALLQV